MPAIREHRRCTKRLAFTLIELLLTIAVIGIIAAVLIPELSSDLPDRLSAASQVVAADIDYARSLAVANNSTYQITFTPAQNKYVLQYSGTNAGLNTLPPSPFRLASDAATDQTTDLGQLPLPLPAVKLAAAVTMQPGAISAPSVEFNSLGATTSSYQTVVWLSCGGGTQQRFISIAVNPVTGLVSIGPVQAALPSDVATLAAGGS